MTEQARQRTLDNLTADMMQALAAGDVFFFSQILKRRADIIHRIFTANTPPSLPQDLARQLADQNSRWLAQISSILNSTRDELNRVSSLREARRHLSRTYGTKRVGRYLSGTG